ncbi:MAG: cytochrome B6 [Candidatus Omnitrophota bacterium]
MKLANIKGKTFLFSILVIILSIMGVIYAQKENAQREKKVSSYLPVVTTEPFPSVMSRLESEKPGVMRTQMNLLNERYDLSDRPSTDTNMSRGKPIQEGVRAKLSKGLTWEQLGEMTPDQIREKGVFPAGFLPLPHPKHAEGGMVFPASHINEIKKQEGRDLTRFDVDFDIPERFLPEFPPAIYLTTRADLGDVSKGKVVTTQNFFELFDGILNPKQIEGLRLLVTPFPQQQFNQTDDRRSKEPSLGVACFDCHVNGSTNGATHLVQDIRPQELRNRLDTPTLRGVNIQRLFGSQRALKTVEDFTQFEQRGAYFDGDPVIASKKGVNVLERASQVHFMAEFQELLDFPPAPKLSIYGRLDPSKATSDELKGQALFFGKANCGYCHPSPHYTDNTMHDLQVERFFKRTAINGMVTKPDGPIKTFPLRGIKDTPPYFHDGRLLTLADVVEFFNLIQQLRLTRDEKMQLVQFLKAI